MTTYAGMNAETGQWITDMDHIRQSIRTALTTNFNTRVMRRNLFTNIPELIDQPFNDTTRLQVMSATALVIVTHESQRLKPAKITISKGTENGSWVVDLVATLRNGIDAGQTVNLAIAI